jgi:hypothetical protein
VDILRRYYDMASAKGETYLWYFPDGTPSSVETSTSPDALPTDGWGSSAMLWALVEGLAGIVDRGRTFDRVEIAPRWLAAGIDDAEVSVGYACSGCGIGYEFSARPGTIVLDVVAEAADVKVHVLLAAAAEARRVQVGGLERTFRNVRIENSRYVDADVRVEGHARVEITLT